MLYDDLNRREYLCPVCSEDVEVDVVHDKEVTCPNCGEHLIIDYDGDYSDYGIPYDCTSLRLKNEN